MAKGRKKVVLDLETKKEFAEVGGRDFVTQLGISVAGIYDYETDIYRAFEEHELPELEELLAGRDEIIGFNSTTFDLPILETYFSKVSVKNFYSTDIMIDVVRALGFRASLNNLAFATLGKKKSGHGLEALQWYREGNVEKVKSYCLDDVRITQALYEYGFREGYILLHLNDFSYHFGLEGARDEYAIPVRWTDRTSLEEVKRGISEAVASKSLLVIDYVSSTAGTQEGFRKTRRVQVKNVTSDGFVAYCFLRKEDREFKFSRVLHIEKV